MTTPTCEPRLITILGLVGSLANQDGRIEASVNPDAASMSKPGWGADTEEAILGRYDADKKLVRVGLSSSVAKELANGTASDGLMSHRWPHRQVQPEIRAQGAADVHSAAMGAITNRDDLADAVRDAYYRARERSARSPHSLVLASVASSSGPSLAIIGGIGARQILNGHGSGNESWQSLLALFPELTDGTDIDRLKTRKAVAYACLRTLEAIALEVARNSRVEIPELGCLDLPPYDEVLISFASLCGASSVVDQLRASWLILSVIADRTRGVGKLMEADSVRRVGHQFQPVELNGRWQARIFAVPRAYKVTLDRHALAGRAAEWAAVTFLSQLLRPTSARPTTLYDRLLSGDTLDLDRLDPQGRDLRPREIDWTPAKMAPSQAELPVLRQITDRVSGDGISQWDAGYRSALDDAVDQVFTAAESERFADSNLLALPAEYEELVAGLDRRIRDLRDAGQGKADRSRDQFDAALAAPNGSGRLSKLIPVGMFDAANRLRGAAFAYAQTAFAARRSTVLGDKLEEWKRHFEAGTGTASRELIAEIDYQVGERGPYYRASQSGWERMQRPAPNISCLYSTRPEFEALYYEAGILEQRLPSGEVRVVSERFKKAATALSREINSAMAHGRGAFPSLVAAIERYFQRLFEEHWTRLSLSSIRTEVLEAALDEAIERINPGEVIDRRSGKRSDYFYCELDGADPDAEGLERMLDARAPSLGFRYERAVRSGESAIIMLGISSGLALDDIVPLRRENETSSVFNDQLTRFHSQNPDTMPVFVSRWFEELVANYDPEVAAIINQSCRP